MRAGTQRTIANEDGECMDNTFLLKERERIVLYGLNNVSRIIADNLKNKGCIIEGIVDRRFCDSSTEITMGGLATRSIPFAELGRYSSDVVIICLNNGLTHRDVARMFHSAGYNKIIYLPMDDYTAQNEASHIRRVYYRIKNNCMRKAEVLPCYRESDIDIISHEETMVVFWCPVNLMHTFTLDMLKDTGNHLTDREQVLSKYANIEISNYTPYVSLFRYLTGEKNNSIQEYLDIQRSNDQDKPFLLNDRKLLFATYEKKIKYDFGFFIDSPTEVIYDGKEKCFHVVDGLHRATYLVTKGYDKVPVIASISDYYCMKDNATP